MALGAMAEVPSLINYQGKLSDKSGNPVNGTKNFTVRIFDAKEGGKEIYKEEIGSVAVKDGLYSFGFGEAGKSVVTPTEILARADGEKQVFNYITKHKPILGNVNISGGGLSWSDDDGSSDISQFTATLNTSSGAASAIFLTKAPDAGTEVSISYDHNSDGVMGALARGGESWLELQVDEEVLIPRERLVSVPFALRAGIADGVMKPQPRIIFKKETDQVWGSSSSRSLRTNHYFDGNSPANLNFVFSFTQGIRGSLSFWMRVMKRDLVKGGYKTIAYKKTNRVFEANKFYDNESLEFNNVDLKGFYNIEFGFNCANGGIKNRVYDMVLLQK